MPPGPPRFGIQEREQLEAGELTANRDSADAPLRVGLCRDQLAGGGRHRAV
jgi:hypothetical protein